MLQILLLVMKIYADCGVIEAVSDFSSTDLQAFFVFGIGIWTKYQSFNVQIQHQQSSWTIISMTSFFNDDPVIQLILDQEEDTFKHTWNYKTSEGFKKISFALQFNGEFGLYEGRWIFNHFTFDFFTQNMYFQIWPFGTDQKYIQNTELQDSTFSLDSFSYTAYYTPNFQGYFSQIIKNNLFLSIDDVVKYVSGCTQKCDNKKTIVKDSYNFDQNNYDLVLPIHLTQNYSVGQWIKFDTNLLNDIEQIFIFGVVAQQMFLDDDFYQDKGDYSVFRIYLNYNQLEPEKTIFLVNTYSYISPIPGYQRQRYQLNLPIQNMDYLKYWFYMEYQHFDRTSQILMYFSLDQKYIVSKFDQVINHFSNLLGNVIYQYNNDDPQIKLAVSSIYQLNYYDCFNDQQTIQVCSDLCKDCFGPLSTQCVSCHPLEESFRIFNPSTTSCDCIYGYIETFKISCKNRYIQPKMEEIFGFNIITEEQRDQQTCKPGQFRGNNNKCFSCPQQYQDSKSILCGDCYVDPQQIKTQILCTYDFIYDEENQSYQNRTRRVQDYQFYLLNLDDGRYIYQSGAIGLCTSLLQANCYNGLPNFTGEKTNISCLPNYVALDTRNYCNLCDKNCLVCNRDTNSCNQCRSKYIVFQQKCVKCPENCLECQNFFNYQIRCLQCAEGYCNSGEQCQKCGSGCLICIPNVIFGQGYINKCVKCIDPYNYYISSDAVNCFRNQISNCLISYVYDSQTQISSFDVYLNRLSNQLLQPNCALCEPGFINTLNECIPDDSLTGQDQIVQQDQNIYKIVKAFDKDQLLKSNCQSDLCELCIYPYYQQQSPASSVYCIKCQIGYYSNFLNGQCLLCPSECYKCIHQHKEYKDAWKWKIKTFNYFILNNQNFNMSPQEIQIAYEAICTECNNGLELFEGNCIQPCDPSCEKCIKEDGQNKCVRCKDAYMGSSLSLYNNKCIQCLFTCKFCFIDQTAKNTQTQVQSSKFLNQQCLVPQPTAKLSYFNNNYRQCEQYNECQKILNITLNVYCDSRQYEFDKWHSFDQKTFLIYNIKISDIFVLQGYSNFGEIEKDYLLEYYNQIQLDKAYYYLNIIPDQQNQCDLLITSKFTSLLKSNVQGLQEQHIIFYSQNQVMLGVRYSIQFQDFSSLTFIKIGFQNGFIQINLIGIDSLIVKNSQILAGDFISDQYKTIVAFDVKNMVFEDVFLDGMKQTGKSIFMFNNPQITINNFSITNINLTRSSVFEFQGNAGGSFIINQFNFQGYFKESSLIKINDNNIDFSIYMAFENFELTLDYNSKIFSCPQIKDVRINRIKFINSIFKLNSFFYQSLETQLLRSSFLNLQFYQSFLYQSTQSGGNKFTFQNLIFNNIQYDSQSFLINVMQSEGQAQIYDLDVTDTTNKFNTLDIYSLFNIQISDIIIKVINIVRTSGLNDFKLSYTNNLIIQDVQFSQSEQYRLFGLQSNDCLQRQLENNIFQTGLNIRNFTILEINNLSVQGIQTVNHPFILIQQVSRSVENIFTSLKIQNCLFSNNQILLTNIDILTSLILIQSDQQGNISINNITVSQNIMVDFIQDMFYNSALFMVVDALYQNVNVDLMNMNQNFVVNSSQSLMRFKAQLVQINNSNFSQQNQYIYQVLKQWLFYGFDIDYKVYHETIQILYPSISQGGVSFIYARQILIDNSIFSQNRAMNGGSLYITCLDLIQVTNSQFIDSKAQLNIIQQYQLSEFTNSGGALYVKSESQNLTVMVSNSTFIDCSATKQGGSIYVDLTTSDVSSIQLQNITIIDSISLQGSFIKLSSQQNKQNSLSMINIQISNTYEILNQFLGSILLTRQADIQTYIQENHLINTEYFNIFIEDLFVKDLHYISLLRLHNNNYIQLKKVRINNVQVFNQTIIDIDQNQIQGKNSYLNQLFISNISQSQPFNLECVDNSDLFLLTKVNMKCFYNVAPKDLQNYISPNKRQNILNCNFNKISQFANNEQYLIDYKTNMQQHQLQFNILSLNNISVPNFQIGLFMIQQVTNKIYQNFIQLKNIQIINCLCGLQGCLNIIGVSNLRLLQDFGIYQSLLQLPQTVKILDSQFINNTAYQGTLNINSVDILINNSIISNNTIKTQGGGIFYQGDKKLYVYFTKISQNTAQEGGAIYLQNFHQSQQISSELEIDSNVALQFSNGIAEFPKSLTIIMKNKQFKTQVIDKTEFNYYEEIVVPNYKPPGLQNQDNFIYLPTGQQLQNYKYFNEKQQQYLQYNLSLRIVALNSQNQIIQNLNGTYCQIYGKASNESNYSSNYFSQSKFTYDLQTNSYNLDDLIIYFNPYQQDYLIIEISCSSIKTPKYSNQPPYSLNGFYNNYKLQLKVKTFECQRGEFYNQTEFSCKQCDASQQFYTVIPGGKCQIKNDINAKSLTSARLELRDGYWRPTETNDRISECYHLKSNCLGGWEPGDKSCFMGHIGALCEQCDIYNTRGDGKYSISKEYQCGNCNQTNQNGLIIFFISLWTLMSIFNYCERNSGDCLMDNLVNKIEKDRFKNGNIQGKYEILFRNRQFQYLSQIISSISTFQLDLPNFFGELVTNIGNPVQAMSYSLDCFLVDLTQTSIIYFRVIWAIIMPIIYSSAFITCYILIIKLKKASYSFSVISTSLIYIYAYLQPNLIGAFISLLSYRNISNILWIQGNVSYKYMTLTHYKWIYAFLSPALMIIWIFYSLDFIPYTKKEQEQSESSEIQNGLGLYVQRIFRYCIFLGNYKNLLKRNYHYIIDILSGLSCIKGSIGVSHSYIL
ncbi:hypothetical protein pb186bvf_020916 [Paramecium bursaria]